MISYIFHLRSDIVGSTNVYKTLSTSINLNLPLWPSPDSKKSGTSILLTAVVTHNIMYCIDLPH